MMAATRSIFSGLVLFVLLYVHFGKIPVAECKQTRTIPFPSLINNGSSTVPEGTTYPENQIIGTIPLVPTLKLGLMSAISSLLLPGLHLTLTFITMIFALVGIVSFLCPALDCNALFRGDEFPPLGSPVAKFRHPVLQQYPPNKMKTWETIPSMIHSLESSYVKYKDARKDE